MKIYNTTLADKTYGTMTVTASGVEGVRGPERVMSIEDHLDYMAHWPQLLADFEAGEIEFED